jgi:hypothetical protein
MQRFMRTALTAAMITTTLSVAAAQAEPLQQTPLNTPIEISGLTGGQENSSCGYLPSTPDQTLRVTEPFASFDIQVAGEGDMTLLIEGPDGFRECLTTDRFSNGQISAPGLLNQGVYKLYVGSQEPRQASYTLSIKQQ